MKKYYILVFVLIGIISCGKESDKSNNFLSLAPDSLNSVPEDYQSENSVVFINSDNEELTLNVTQNKYSDVTFVKPTHEYYRYFLSSEGNEVLRLYLGVTQTSIDRDDEVYSSGLTVDLSFGFGASMSLDINNGELESNSIIEKDLSFLGRDFKNVFLTSPSNLNIFNEVGYNSKYGVVTFIDGHGERWVFNRFK